MVSVAGRRTSLGLLALALGLGLWAACTGSPAPPPPDGVDPEPQPWTGASGDACDNGAIDCHWELGCVDGSCAPCTEASQCRGLEACREDGSCGECSDSGQCREGEDCAEGFCMPAELPRWEITIEPDALEAVISEDVEGLTAAATLAVDGTDYGECQLRLRGGSSRGLPKKSFRLEFPEDAEHPGYSRKINLRSEYNDFSYVRSFVGYETFRRLTDLPTPRFQYLRLDINGEFYGLMTEVERVGGRFLEGNGRDRDRSMYEGEKVTGGGALMPMAGLEDYRDRYPKRSGGEDYDDLIGFIEQDLWADFEAGLAVDSTEAEQLRETVHVDGYIDYLATMVMLQNQDHVTNNFFLSSQRLPYRPGEARWEFYPWDLDLTLGCLWDEENEDALCDEFTAEGFWLEGAVWDWDPENCWCNQAIHVTLRDPELFEDYRERVCARLDGPWWTERAPSLVEAIRQTIGEAVAEDSLDFPADSEEWSTYTQEVVDFFALRRSFLREELACD